MGLTRTSATARASVLAMVFACGMSFSATAMAQVDPHLTCKHGPAQAEFKNDPNADFGPGLPFFDARLDDEGTVLPRVTALLPTARTPELDKLRAADVARLRAMVEGVMIDDDPMLGTARFVRSTWKFLSPAKPAAEKWTPKDIVKEFIAAYPGLMESGVSEIDLARVERDFITDHNQVRHLTYQQQIRGADLFESEVRANVMPTGELINIQNTMLPRPEGDFITPPITFDAASAIRIAAANVGIMIAGQPVAATEPEPGSLRQEWAKLPELRDDETIVTKLVYFAIDRKTIHPAWHVIVPVKGVGHTYDIHVDATDGSILRRHDWLCWDTTQPVTMRVFPSDGIAPGTPGNSTPTTFQFPVVSSQLLTWNPSDVSPWSPNGWINDGNMETTGNNVDAYTDADATANSPDLPRPNGGASRVFNLTFDPALAPNANQTQKDATVVELFYRSNWYHDKLMALGFNEAARNFQLTNFSGLGTAGDYVRAEAQDGSGTNNANFGTSGGDGTTARCQMYIFTGPTPDRDGSYEGDIVYHELTHGTSIRLHNGLSGTQPGGMGEGWSDFVAHCLLAEPTDDPNGVYPMGGYTTNLLGAGYNTNYYFGIRRFPYSTDLTKAPQTFADIATAQQSYDASIPRSTVIGNTATEVHNVGEVWCEMLNEGRAALWHTYGFAGNQRMLQIVIDGMKLSVAQPTFLQARDAILAADLAGFGGADTAILWQAFAKRGLGFSATSPASSGTVGLVEAYDTPNFATFTYPDGLPTQLSPSVGSTFRVNVAGTGLTLTPASGQLFMSVNGGAYAPVALATTATPNQYIATIPAQACFASVNFYFSTGTSLGAKTDPSTAPAARYSALTYTGISTPVSDGFETDLGWTVGPNTATTGLWVRADPVAALTGGTTGTEVQPENAHSGTMCWVTGNGAVGAANGTQDVDGGLTTLNSPVYNLSTYANATVSYWRWYSNGSTTAAPFTDTFRVDVSIDGGTNWVNAETVGPGSSVDPNVNPGWRFASWTFGGLGLVPTAQVRVRFIAEDAGTGSVVEAALDDFKIDVFSCTPAISGGACCVPAGICSVAATAGACIGTYQGDGTVCSPNPCTPATYTLSVSVTGSGRGSVSSTPGTILCPSTCDGVFSHGTLVTLSATPSANSLFVGWTGACSGTGTCAQTITGPVSVSAEFRCKSDFNGTGGTTVADIFDFLNAWFAGQPAADFNGTGGTTVADIFDFLNAWFAGCP